MCAYNRKKKVNPDLFGIERLVNGSHPQILQDARRRQILNSLGRDWLRATWISGHELINDRKPAAKDGCVIPVIRNRRMLAASKSPRDPLISLRLNE